MTTARSYLALGVLTGASLAAVCGVAWLAVGRAW